MATLAVSGQSKSTRNTVGFPLPAAPPQTGESNIFTAREVDSPQFRSEGPVRNELVSLDCERSQYNPGANRKIAFAVASLLHGLAMAALFAGFGPGLGPLRVEKSERLTVVQLAPPAPPPAPAAAEAAERKAVQAPDMKAAAIADVPAPVSINLAPNVSPTAAVAAASPAAWPPMRDDAPKPTVAEAPPAPDRVEIKQQQSRYAGVLMAHLGRHKRYPRELRDAGIQGRGLVLFNLTADGRIASLKLVRSTGSPELDRQIRSIFERAQPFPIPDWSRDVFQTSYTLPVDFTITS